MVTFEEENSPEKSMSPQSPQSPESPESPEPLGSLVTAMYDQTLSIELQNSSIEKFEKI